MYQVHENVRERDRGEGESEDSTNDDFVICQLVSILTLRQMSPEVTDVIKW